VIRHRREASHLRTRPTTETGWLLLGDGHLLLQLKIVDDDWLDTGPMRINQTSFGGLQTSLPSFTDLTSFAFEEPIQDFDWSNWR
jgi:hypothetical protein